MSDTLIGDSEFFEDFPHWVDALNRGIPIVIPDVAQMLAFVGLSQHYLGEFINEAEAESDEAKKMENSVAGVRYSIRGLKEKGIFDRHGSNENSRWEIHLE